MNDTSSNLGLPDAGTLPALLKELESHGANRRSASPQLRAALAEVKQQIDQPDLFGCVAIQYADAALAADAPRYKAEQREETRRSMARAKRDRVRRERRTVSWSKCCVYLYHRNAHEHHFWTHCHKCKKPLAYGDDIPGMNVPR